MRSLIVSIVSFAALMLGIVPVHAAADPETSSSQAYADLTIQNVRVTTFKRGINRPCPEQSKKMLIMDITVQDDSDGYFEDYTGAFAHTTLRRGIPWINTDQFRDSLNGYRTATFYLYLDKRTTKIRKDSAWNSATVMGSQVGMSLTASLRADCVEEAEGNDILPGS